MDELQASLIVESWRGGAGLVSRGPRWLLGFAPADPADVERHTGRRARSGEVWRVQVGGRFLGVDGTVYPGGVPFPEELAGKVAAVSTEVWLYVEPDEQRIVGSYSWPEAVRRPIAARPEPDFLREELSDASVAEEGGDVRIEFPRHPRWEQRLVSRSGPGEVVVLCIGPTLPDPLNEMVLFSCGGLSLRMVEAPGRPDLDAIAQASGPPYRGLAVGDSTAVGREPGRALGPHTWPWPGELIWWREGQRYTLRGDQPLAVLGEVAETVS
ncbi:MAG TPA: hypothetical protein VM840_07980 [Actinomycetota bacterium]|nr:hypothetical protein [Actinomycetota bacterium]